MSCTSFMLKCQCLTLVQLQDFIVSDFLLLSSKSLFKKCDSCEYKEVYHKKQSIVAHSSGRSLLFVLYLNLFFSVFPLILTLMYLSNPCFFPLNAELNKLCTWGVSYTYRKPTEHSSQLPSFSDTWHPH